MKFTKSSHNKHEEHDLERQLRELERELDEFKSQKILKRCEVGSEQAQALHSAAVLNTATDLRYEVLTNELTSLKFKIADLASNKSTSVLQQPSRDLHEGPNLGHRRDIYTFSVSEMTI